MSLPFSLQPVYVLHFSFVIGQILNCTRSLSRPHTYHFEFNTDFAFEMHVITTVFDSKPDKNAVFQDSGSFAGT